MRAALTLCVLLLASCSTVTVVRLSPGAVDVGPNQRAIAAIQANVTSGYFLFIPIPGDANLDRAVNRLLIATAKSMGADRITHVEFDATPDGGIWRLRRLLGWRSAEAKAIAVQVIEPSPTSTAAGVAIQQKSPIRR